MLPSLRSRKATSSAPMRATSWRKGSSPGGGIQRPTREAARANCSDLRASSAWRDSSSKPSTSASVTPQIFSIRMCLSVRAVPWARMARPSGVLRGASSTMPSRRERTLTRPMIRPSVPPGPILPLPRGGQASDRGISVQSCTSGAFSHRVRVWGTATIWYTVRSDVAPRSGMDVSRISRILRGPRSPLKCSPRAMRFFRRVRVSQKTPSSGSVSPQSGSAKWLVATRSPGR